MAYLDIRTQTGERKVKVVHVPGVTISVVTEVTRKVKVKTCLVFSKEKEQTETITLHTKVSTRREKIEVVMWSFC